MTEPITHQFARAREVARVREHLEGAMRQVLAATHAGLPDDVVARRRGVIAHLRRYIDAGQYPVNRVRAEPTPVFVDEGGARCAMAALLEATGHHAVVERVARTANLARVHDLAGDAEFIAWLDHHGVTVDEAARIQPSYAAYSVPAWQPTASALVSAHVGGGAAGAQVLLAPAVRVGVRRVTRGSDDHGVSQYGSLALVAEYARSFVVSVGSTNQLSLLVQWETIGNHSDVQWYLIGGPMASLDEDDAPGHGFGAQFGAGFSFRRRDVPLFAELMGQGLAQGGAVFRVGVQLGLVW